MGILDFLFKRGEREVLTRVHYSLKNSFTNVKKDMTHLHKTVSDNKEHTTKKFQEFEDRIKKLELVLHSNHPQQLTKILIQKEPEQEEIQDSDSMLSILEGLPKSELKLFKTLYELQLSLNAKQISYKSLASYLYPGKDYNSIRSSITQFVLRLNTEGLIEKQRIGKETYVKISQQGHKLLKNAKNKKLIKELEATST